MVGVQARTGLRREAPPVRAETALCLPGAGRMPKIGRGASHVGDITFPERMPGHGLDLAHHALMAARGDEPPLMKSQRAEAAGAEAAPAVDDGEAHLFYGRHAAHWLVPRMGLPGEGQSGHGVEFRRVKRHGGRICNKIAAAVGLRQHPPPDGVVLGVFRTGRRGIGAPGSRHLLKGGQTHGGRLRPRRRIPRTGISVISERPRLLSRPRFRAQPAPPSSNEQVRLCSAGWAAYRVVQ